MIVSIVSELTTDDTDDTDDGIGLLVAGGPMLPLVVIARCTAAS